MKVIDLRSNVTAIYYVVVNFPHFLQTDELLVKFFALKIL